jgi:hypothetical protein
MNEQQLDEAIHVLATLGNKDPVVEFYEVFLDMGIMPDGIKSLANNLILDLAVPAHVLRGEHHADLGYSSAAR